MHGLLSPAELEATTIPDEYNNALLDLQIVKQRKERMLAENKRLEKIMRKQLDLVETLDREIDGREAERDNLIKQNEALSMQSTSQRRRQ